MPKITAPLRGRRAVKRVDLTDLREVLRDRRMWSAIGVVTKPDDAEHFEEITGPSDVLVEVVLQPTLIPVTCRLPAVFWTVPDVGEEVAVLIPEGAPDFMPIIVAILSSNSLPSAQGPAAHRIAITRAEVVVHDGAGGADPLPTLADVEAIKSAIAGAAVISGDGGAAFKANILAALSSWPVGTTILKAK